MTDQHIEYYAITGIAGQSQPSGLARRRLTKFGRVDEALQRDLTWKRDTAIIEAEHGDQIGELVPITEDEAQQLINRFREKWAGADE